MKKFVLEHGLLNCVCSCDTVDLKNNGIGVVSEQPTVAPLDEWSYSVWWYPQRRTDLLLNFATYDQAMQFAAWLKSHNLSVYVGRGMENLWVHKPVGEYVPPTTKYFW